MIYIYIRVVVHECPPVSLPWLLSDGRQARVGLGYQHYPILQLNALQMAAPRAAICIPPSNGADACMGATPHPHLWAHFQLAVGWDTLWTATLAIGMLINEYHWLPYVFICQTRSSPGIGSALTTQMPKFSPFRASNHIVQPVI